MQSSLGGEPDDVADCPDRDGHGDERGRKMQWLEQAGRVDEQSDRCCTEPDAAESASAGAMEQRIGSKRRRYAPGQEGETAEVAGSRTVASRHLDTSDTKKRDALEPEWIHIGARYEWSALAQCFGVSGARSVCFIILRRKIERAESRTAMCTKKGIWARLLRFLQRSLEMVQRTS